MKKHTFKTMNHVFESNRKGAKFTTDGIHYMNAGEFCEATLKDYFGFEATKDACTAYDQGHDIPELKASVKSSKATLTCKITGETMDEILNTYFNTCPSETWFWVVLYEDISEAEAYEMNRDEFEAFTRNWAKVERNVVRYKATSGKMVKWLEERI